jgi:cyanophycin synthetase
LELAQLKILETQVFRGANYWAPLPVIRLLIEIAQPETRSTNLISGFYEDLTAMLPALREHHCSRGKADGFLERVREGTDLGHVLQHVALELQNMVGQKLDCAQPCLATDPLGKLRPASQQIVFHYEQPDVGMAAGKVAVQLLESFLAPGCDPKFDFPSKLKELFELARMLSYGPSTRALVAEAKRRDIPVQRLEESRDRVQLGRSTRALRSLLQLGYGKYQRRMWAPYISTESHLATDIALNKDLTNRLVRNAGLPVPQSIRVNDEKAAVTAARKIGYPVVLKPLDGNHGRGVGVNLSDEAAVRAHYPLALAQTHTGTVLVENFLPGNTYRVLVVGGRAIAATEEVPAHVVGDGSHTLRQLVKLTNADPRRGHGSESLLVRIRLDEVAIALAQEQGYGPNDVPPVGKRVQLVRTAHISLGGISVDHTDKIHPYNAMIAEQAAQVVGLQVAGIDLIAPEIGRSLLETGGGICEVNAGPGLGLHAEPVVGKPRDVVNQRDWCCEIRSSTSR